MIRKSTLRGLAYYLVVGGVVVFAVSHLAPIRS